MLDGVMAGTDFYILKVVGREGFAEGLPEGDGAVVVDGRAIF
jgi:hypothetical protein